MRKNVNTKMQSSRQSFRVYGDSHDQAERKKTLICNEILLTAFNRMRGHLKRHELASRLRNMDAKDQAHACVFSSNISLSIS